MSFATIAVSIFLFIWFVCAAIYLYKNKGCSGGCENCGRRCRGQDREYMDSKSTIKNSRKELMKNKGKEKHGNI